MSTSREAFALILPAAGEGTRLGYSLPKALVPIHGVPLVRRAVDRFAHFANLAEVIVAAPAAHLADVQAALCGAVQGSVVLRVVAGGPTRQGSVAIALDAVGESVSLVCVHDAARPLVSEVTIRAVMAAAARTGAATVASRPADSVRQDVPGGATRALDRTTLWMVETPQVFAVARLREAHRVARARDIAATDDAALVETVTGIDVAVVAGDGPNTKVTTRADLELVSLLCR